jgi:hypothetical protein
LEDVRLYSREALMGQGAIAEEAEIDDVHVCTKEHDGSHIRGGICEDTGAGDLLKIPKNRRGDADPVYRYVGM